MSPDTRKDFPGMENISKTLDDDADKLIVGLDFGTTFSGIAYAFTGTGKIETTPITDWPGNKGKNPPKVPTVIRYDPDNKSAFTWGYEIEQTSLDKIEGIKLLLDPDHAKPLYVPPVNSRAELKRLGKPPVDVASDYMKAIYTHALHKIESTNPKEYIQMLQKKFVLSVPAVWSDKAKDITLKAAEKAGIYPVTLIKEPEAAALYTLHYMKDRALGVGDAFVICDAGGGTVDLISYEITQRTPLELKELVPGSGGLAGSLMLNKRFEQHIKDIVGERVFFDLQLQKGYRAAMKQFDEDIKTAFTSVKDEYLVNFPLAKLKNDPANNIEDSTYTLTGDTLQEIFQPLIDNILSLVKDQVSSVKIKRMEADHPKAREVKAIFLVGGFGSSAYLKDCIQKANPTIQVIQPVDAWSAIVKGAVLQELPHVAVITSSVATRHYGVEYATPYNEEDDKGQPKRWDKYQDVFRVLKMEWYILAGDDLQRDQKITFPFVRQLPANYTSDHLIFEEELIQCETINAPKYPIKGVTTINCKLRADLRSVPKDEFRLRTKSDGTTYYDYGFTLVISIVSASMVFSMEINGKELGKVEAKYD